jgi:hypothetical protein
MTRLAVRAYISLALVLLSLTTVGVERARATTAGTVISDTVTMGYQDALSTMYSAISNTVTTTVANLPSLSISTPAGQNVTAKMLVIDTFTLTNTGNAAGNFQVLNSPPFGGTATGTTLSGYVLNGATSSTCSTASLCSLSVLGTQLAGLSATAINGTITIGVAYQALGGSGGQTVQTPLTANISYPVNGGVAAATGAMTATATDTLIVGARLDLQASATQPGIGATITWTIKGNNGGSNVGYDSQAAKNLLNAGAAGVVVLTQVPAFGGTALTLQSTPTCVLAGGAGGTAALYYSTTASNPTGANWSTTYASNAAWVACYVSGGAGGSELPSAPGSGPGSVGTAQLTLTIVTAQPSGNGSDASGAVSLIANGYMDGAAWATGEQGLLGPGIAPGTADSSGVPLNTSATESNLTPSSGTVQGGASNVAGSQGAVAQPRLDVKTTVVQPSSASAIAWTVVANNGGTGNANGSNTCLAGVQPAGGPQGVCIIVKLPTFGGVVTPLAALPTLSTSGLTSTSNQLLYSTSASTPTDSSSWTTVYTTSATWVAAYVWSTLDTYGNGTNTVLPSATGGSSGAGVVTTAQITLNFTTVQPSGAGAYASGVLTVIANGIVDDVSNGLVAPGIPVGTNDPNTAAPLAADIAAVENNVTPSVTTIAPGGASQVVGSQAWSGVAPRMDVQESATAPGATITWTVKANNGGPGAAWSTLAVKTDFLTTNSAIAVIVKQPTFGGSALTLQATLPTCVVTGGFTCTLYYGRTAANAFPPACPTSACTTAPATTWGIASTYAAASTTWIAAVVTSASTTSVSMYASTPAGSAGAGTMTTPQITLTFVTAQPSGATTGSFTAMATALVADSGAKLVGPGVTVGTADSAAVTQVSVAGLYGVPAAVGSLDTPGGASNNASSQVAAANITTGPYETATTILTGSYPAAPNLGAAAANNNNDFTAIAVPCTSAGGAANNGSTCTVDTTGTKATIINSVANAGDALTTVTLTADAPPGWTVQLYNASACSGGGTTWPACTTGTSIAGPSTDGGIVSGPITVASGGTTPYKAVYNATSNLATPFAAADALIIATGAYGGIDTNTTHNDIYPGGVLELTQTVAVTSTNCPAGISPTNLGACPGGVLTYSLGYTNIAPTGSTVTNKGSEPLFAYNALISKAGGVVITVDGTVAGNLWAANTFGLNAAPSDTTAGTTYTYTGPNLFSSGTYPSNTSGHTGFIATVGGVGAGNILLAGQSGTITYNVTVK